MADNLSVKSDGRAEMAYTGSVPWHGLGTRLDAHQTPAGMLSAAGLDWTVQPRSLHLANGTLVASHVALTRSDTSAVLGVATRRYQTIQNAQAAEIVDALVTEGGAHAEVAGALGRGERCWMLTRIPGEFEVLRDDLIRPYFLLAWGHDGRHGVAGRLTPIRVVCANTLAAAGFGAGQWSLAAAIYLRHYGQIKLRIDEARQALGIAQRQSGATANAYRAMAATSLNDPTSYFHTVFPPPERDPGTERYDDAKLARWEARQAEILTRYQCGAGMELAGVSGSVWGAYNAVTDWVDHQYPVLRTGFVSSSRQQATVFGAMAENKTRAFQAALDLVAG